MPIAMSSARSAIVLGRQLSREPTTVCDGAPSLLVAVIFLRTGPRDLDEVEEIAEPGPMRLHLCDMALERARLAFAQIEAFAPLSGMIDDGPLSPVVPEAEEAARLREEAR